MGRSAAACNSDPSHSVFRPRRAGKWPQQRCRFASRLPRIAARSFVSLGVVNGPRRLTRILAKSASKADRSASAFHNADLKVTALAPGPFSMQDTGQSWTPVHMNQAGYRNFRYAGWLLQRDIGDKWTLGGGLVSRSRGVSNAANPLGHDVRLWWLLLLSQTRLSITVLDRSHGGRSIRDLRLPWPVLDLGPQGHGLCGDPSRVVHGRKIAHGAGRPVIRP
jgi:hypothetical protein